jgi:exonuclease SbcD
MSAGPFRFLHAADFHLEQPLAGLREVPEHLRDVLIDAPYRAAELVFDCAIAESVDFVLLAGDIAALDEAGPRAIGFLMNQFQRLAERQIAVYWAGGEVDAPAATPEEVRWPKNVHIFAPDKPSTAIYERRGQVVANIVGQSATANAPIRAKRFAALSQPPFTIALAYGQPNSKGLEHQGIDYWALGGQHQAANIGNQQLQAWYAGSPQARHVAQTGAHGCVLVSVDFQGQVDTRQVETDVVRFHQESLTCTRRTTADDLRQLLVGFIETLAATTRDQITLASWKIAAEEPLANQLRRGGLVEQLLSEFRAEFGSAKQVVWITDIDVESSSDLPAAWYDEDTILGDFLSAVRQHADGNDALELGNFVSEAHAAGILSDATVLADSPMRQRVLRRAAMLGADLLRPPSTDAGLTTVSTKTASTDSNATPPF